MNVLVIGAGVVGLTKAISLAEADNTAPDYTNGHAANVSRAPGAS